MKDNEEKKYHPPGYDVDKVPRIMNIIIHICMALILIGFGALIFFGKIYGFIQ